MVSRRHRGPSADAICNPRVLPFADAGTFGSRANDAQDGKTVLRPQGKIVFLTLVLLTAAACRAADFPSAAVSGVVRDSQGIVQMGALVQILTADSSMVGTAITDLHGRYLIAHLVPGKYQVRATAALFIPALKGNLVLRSGARAVVDLTLNTLFESSAWIPAERRKTDEPSDDWKWTLRSAANRPILRWNEDGNVMMVSTSATENHQPVTHANTAMTAGGGGFGGNGVHNVFTVDRVLNDGSGVRMRADVGSVHGSSVNSPSIDVSTGYESRLGLAGVSRTVIGYHSHPEMIASNGVVGLEAMQLASAEKMQIGDFAEVEAGGTIYVLRTSAYAMASQPFLKVTVHPISGWSVGYRMATSQNLQSYAGLDDIQQDVPAAVMYRGHVQMDHGLHQEFSLGKKIGPGIIQASYYRDSLDRVMIAGGGALSPASIVNPADIDQPLAKGLLADSSTGNFRLMGAGYNSQGVNVVLSEPLTKSIWIAVEYATGSALSVKDAEAIDPANPAASLTPDSATSATVALKGRIVRSGTRVRAAYRWQPSRFVTAIDPYASFGDQAFFSCYLRQAIRLGHLLPPGLDATVDITNLLAQGYRPFLSKDGETLFLAQAPRTLQAGLAFTF